jgi:hypothetical protein
MYNQIHPLLVLMMQLNLDYIATYSTGKEYSWNTYTTDDFITEELKKDES